MKGKEGERVSSTLKRECRLLQRQSAPSPTHTHRAASDTKIPISGGDAGPHCHGNMAALHSASKERALDSSTALQKKVTDAQENLLE